MHLAYYHLLWCMHLVKGYLRHGTPLRKSATLNAMQRILGQPPPPQTCPTKQIESFSGLPALSAVYVSQLSSGIGDPVCLAQHSITLNLPSY